jgi:hypothetical protein
MRLGVLDRFGRRTVFGGLDHLLGRNTGRLGGEDFAALGVGWVALALMGREPAWAVLVALAVFAALAELLAGAAFFTAVTSTSSQGVVDLALWER